MAQTLVPGDLQTGPKEANAAADHTAPARASSFERKRLAKKPLPAHLPRRRMVVPAQCSCPSSGCERPSKLGKALTETLEVVPRRWKVIQTMRERFSCRNCEKISQLLTPFHSVPRG